MSAAEQTARALLSYVRGVKSKANGKRLSDEETRSMRDSIDTETAEAQVYATLAVAAEIRALTDAMTRANRKVES